jgi:DNA polymerase-4
VDATIVRLAERLAQRMLKRGHAGRTIVLRLRFADFTRATRSRSLPKCTTAAEVIIAVARGLHAEARPAIAQRGLTLVGLTVAGIEQDDRQLELPVGDA